VPIKSTRGLQPCEGATGRRRFGSSPWNYSKIDGFSAASQRCRHWRRSIPSVSCPGGNGSNACGPSGYHRTGRSRRAGGGAGARSRRACDRSDRVDH
jgi:hypothetical protein